MPSRRAFLAGAAVLAAVGIGVGIEEPAIRRRVDVALAPDPARPSTSPGPASSGVLASRAMGRDVAWRIVRPPGTDPGVRLPVALVLHGRGGTAASAFRDLWFDRYLAAVVAAGAPPLALTSVDGGDDSYWHRRRDGTDAQAMLVDEFLPLLGTQGLAIDRFGLFGWSMGGYGALLLGARLGPARTSAICAVSPALWTSSGATAPGAFDGADDYAANSVWGLPALASIPIRIDCGDSDPFYSATKQYIAQLPNPPAGGFSPGGHDGAFWSSQQPAEIAWLAPLLVA